jgi:hypothetical protein
MLLWPNEPGQQPAHAGAVTNLEAPSFAWPPCDSASVGRLTGGGQDACSYPRTHHQPGHDQEQAVSNPEAPRNPRANPRTRARYVAEDQGHGEDKTGPGQYHWSTRLTAVIHAPTQATKASGCCVSIQWSTGLTSFALSKWPAQYAAG